MSPIVSIPITIVPMTPEEYKGKEKRLTISYSFFTVPTGSFLVASTTKGVCFMMPGDMKWNPVETLKKHFPKAHFRCQKVAIHKTVAQLLRNRPVKDKELVLHIYGTPFQLAVWTDLLQIPSGKVTTYLNIAQRIGNPKAARPVGQAVGSNPVMCLIPCHRVICSNGKLGGFRWGVERKIKFLNKEARSSHKVKNVSNWEPTLF